MFDFCLIFKSIFLLLGKNIVLWVGGYAVGTNRTFTWVATGANFTYTYWYGQNPDFFNSEEYCVQIGYRDMQWNDNKCTNKYGFVCEFKPNCCGNGNNCQYINQNIIISNYQNV